jgi:hypothetical protein
MARTRNKGKRVNFGVNVAEREWTINNGPLPMLVGDDTGAV